MALYEDVTAYDDLPAKYDDVPPVLAVEVLSPNDRMSRITRKVADYLRAGVRVVWLLDPGWKDVSVYRASGPPGVLGADEVVEGEPELPGFRCRVADFFFVPGQPGAGATSAG